MLLAGGSGIVPLRSMLRHRLRTGSDVPTCLLYSSRSWEDVIYRDELGQHHDEVRVSNAIGGLLIDVFGTEMTAASSTCAVCSTRRPGLHAERAHR
jgi:ferredoxin-NADP reductase